MRFVDDIIQIIKALDVLIKNGTVIDGSGNPEFYADIAIIDDRIVAMERLDHAEAALVIDANGMIVAPGFIDAHSHTDATVLYNPTLDSSIRQGVTTEIVGNCGNSFVPAVSVDSVQALKINGIRPDGDVPCGSLGAFAAYLEKRGIRGNLAWLVGHNAVCRWGKDPWDCYFDILAQAGAALHGVTLIGELFTDAFTHQAIAHPLLMLTSDGYSTRADGKLAEQSLFPVHFMGMVHFLIHFVRETNTLTLTEAIRKMTGMPASQFRLADCGLLKPGFVADLVIFNFERLHSDSSFAHPLYYPQGVEHVLVNGVPVICQSEPTEAMPGRNLLRRSGSSWAN